MSALRRLSAAFFVACLALSCLVVPALSRPSIALAAPSLQVSTNVSERHPEAGAPFLFELTISSAEPIGAVGRPDFIPPVGFSVSGPNNARRTEMHIVNGVSSTSSSVVLTWVLTAPQAGTFTIPGPRVDVDGSTVNGKSITIDVVPSTGAAPPPPAFPSPFLLSPSSPFDLDDQPDDSAPTTADDLALPTAADDLIFLHATADRTEAYLGQQITLSFYVYYRVDFEMTERKEAALSDFLRVPLLNDPSSTTAQYTRVGGKRFGARLIDRLAVFPLKSGKLSTGSISARFKGRRIGAGVLRTSNELTIDVKEPPKDGRPPGYVLGDVGHFIVNAAVQPRQTLQGSSVSVTVKVEGVGNLPSSLHMPQQKGVEWLDPERKDALVTRDGKIGGARTFGYVAVLKNSGKVDLGEVELPFFNPDTKAYEIAKAKIGEVDVVPTDPKPDDIARAKGGGDEDLLARLPKSRAGLGAYAPREVHALPTWGLAGAIAAPPLLVILGFGLGLVGGGLKRRREEKRGSARTAVKEALDEARAAEKSGDAKALAAAVERAVHAAVEASTGLASRGVLRSALGDDLVSRGVPKELAEDVLGTLSLCEDLRYSPGADASAMQGLVDRGRELTKKLDRVDARRASKAEEPT